MKKLLQMRGLILAAFILTASAAPLPAALLLTVDTTNKTLTWSGSVTSEELIIPSGGVYTLRLGSNDWIGGHIVRFDGLLVTGVEPYSWLESDHNPVVSSNGFYLNLGDFLNHGFDRNEPGITLTGDEVAFYYGDYDAIVPILEEAHGIELFFQLYDTLPDSTFGPVAARVVVIPEPSSLLLAGGAVALLGLAYATRKGFAQA